MDCLGIGPFMDPYDLQDLMEFVLEVFALYDQINKPVFAIGIQIAGNLQVGPLPIVSLITLGPRQNPIKSIGLCYIDVS